MADYELLEQTLTKDKPVKFVMLTNKGTPASLVGEVLLSSAAASDRVRVVDDIKTNNKYLIVNSEDFNYRFKPALNCVEYPEQLIPALKRK